jgi:hypothetical protein
MTRISKSRRQALAGGAALVLGGVALTTAKAKAEPDEDVFIVSGEAGPFEDRRKKWLQSVADKLGVTPDKLETALTEASKDLGLPAPPMIMPLTIGRLGPEPPGAEAFTLEIGSPLGPAARALGISEDQLKSEWTNTSLNDIARAHNVDPKVVADALKAQRTADLDKAVAAGKLPSQVADRLKAHLSDEVAHLMEFPGGPGRAIFRFEQRGRMP